MLQGEDKAAALDEALAAMRRVETEEREFEVAPKGFNRFSRWEPT